MYGDSIITESDRRSLQEMRSKPLAMEGDIWKQIVSDKPKVFFKYLKYDRDPFGSFYTFNDMHSELGFRYLAWTTQIRNSMVVIDAGAHYGAYTLPALAKGATVHSFEPNPFNYDHLLMNVKANSGFIDRFHGEQLALFDRSGLEFDWMEINNMKTVTVDDYCKNFKRLDFIKIDVEGAELHVLRGAINTIRKFEPILIIENHHNYNPNIECRVIEYVINDITEYNFFTIRTSKDDEISHTFFHK